MASITVSNTNTIAEIQAILDDTGYGLTYDTVYFNEGNYAITQPLYINSGTNLIGLEVNTHCNFQLMQNAPTDVFRGETEEEMVGIINQKDPNDIHDVVINGIDFNGRRDYQIATGDLYYHNFIYFINAYNVSVTGVASVSSLGYNVYIKYARNIKLTVANSLTCKGTIYLKESSEVLIKDIVCLDNTNPDIVIDSCFSVSVYGCEFYNIIGEASSIHIKIINSRLADLNDIQNESILIYENIFYHALNASIWIINNGEYSANKNKLSNILIRNNIFAQNNQTNELNLGTTILWSGWDGVEIRNNNFINCFGSAIKCGSGSEDVPQGTDYSLLVRNNIFYSNDTEIDGSNVSYFIINSLPDTHTIISKHNLYYGYTDGKYLDVISENDIEADPVFAYFEVYDATYINADYHERSLNARWDSYEEEWVRDEEHSPVIDAGDPAMYNENEDTTFSKRVNIGRYGNTWEASKSEMGYRFVMMGDG